MPTNISALEALKNLASFLEGCYDQLARINDRDPKGLTEFEKIELEHIKVAREVIQREENTTTPPDGMELLRYILERFPQADPESEFYDEEIDGCDAVNFFSEIVPQIRECLEKNTAAQENQTLQTLQAAWNFIENVTDDDPERNDKFFALREKVRNVFWDERKAVTPTVAIILEGGLVQSVVSDYPNLLSGMNLMVLDYDTEGADKDELLAVPQPSGSLSEATGRYEGIERAKIDLTAVMKQLDERGW